MTTSEDYTITTSVTEPSATTTAAAGDSAKQTAVKVNALQATTGVSATAGTIAELTVSGTTAGLNLTINGTAFVCQNRLQTSSYAALADALTAYLAARVSAR